MTISPFARMYLFGTLEQPLPFIPYLEVKVASLRYQAIMESYVRRRFREYLHKTGKDPSEWKMTGGYSPHTLKLYLGKACTPENILTVLSHEIVHHLICYLVGSMATSGMDFLITNEKDKKKLREMLLIDGKQIL